MILVTHRSPCYPGGPARRGQRHSSCISDHWPRACHTPCSPRRSGQLSSPPWTHISVTSVSCVICHCILILMSNLLNFLSSARLSLALLVTSSLSWRPDPVNIPAFRHTSSRSLYFLSKKMYIWLSVNLWTWRWSWQAYSSQPRVLLWCGTPEIIVPNCDTYFMHTHKLYII